MPKYTFQVSDYVKKRRRKSSKKSVKKIVKKLKKSDNLDKCPKGCEGDSFDYDACRAKGCNEKSIGEYKCPGWNMGQYYQKKLCSEHHRENGDKWWTIDEFSWEFCSS